MNQKMEYAFPTAVAKQINLSKKALPIANTKNNEWFCPITISLVSVKSIFLNVEDSLCVFKNGLTFKSFFFWIRCLLILNDRSSFVLKKNKNNADNCQFLPCIDVT